MPFPSMRMLLVVVLGSLKWRVIWSRCSCLRVLEMYWRSRSIGRRSENLLGGSDEMILRQEL